MRILAACAAALLIFGACGSRGLPTVPTPVPATFTLAFGEAGRAVNTEIQSLGILQDTRCPLNANCVQAGDVTASFRFIVGKTSSYFQLQLADPAKRTSSLNGYVVELLAVAPHPLTGQTIRREDYRVTVEVRGG